jgi:hypothetical protein
MRRTMTFRIVAGLVACTQLSWLCAPLEASERRLGGSLLEVHQRAEKFVDPSNNNQAGLRDRPVYVLKKGDTITLRLVDQNPLLFTYGAELTAEETDQHKIAVEFAKTLVQLLEAFKSVKGAGTIRPFEVEGLNIRAFREQLGILQNRILSLPSKIDESIGTATDIANLKGDVSSWRVPALAEQITKGYEKVAIIAGRCLAGLPLSTSDGQRVMCSDPAEPVQPVAALLEAQEPLAIGGPFESQQSISNAPPPKPVGVTPAPAVPPAQPVRPPAAAPAAAAPAAAASGESIQAFITLAVAMQSKVDSSLGLIKAFAADVAAVGTPRALPPGKDKEPVTYSLENQTVTVIVGANTKYDDFMNAPVKKVRQEAVGKYPIDLKPYAPATIGVKPAFVVLFGKNPTFKAAKSGDQFEIQEEDPQGVGYNVAAMLTVTPRAWAEPTFGGHFQVGVSPTKDKIGIYLGAGISVQQVFTFGLGASWQQVRRLASGLSVGQKIASADLLKTETEYRPGLYFHITANLPTRK